MHSDSVTSFLDLARQHRLLPPDQVEDLFQQPDVPHYSLSDLCDLLQRRGVLTRYQADLIRAGRGLELNFAGYPIVDEIGPIPGGTAYKALHPSLRSPVVMRRIRPDWLAPADNVAAYILRAQAACPVTHPNLSHVLDAGAYREEPFVTLDPFDGADLETLIRDIGPMPASLATVYSRQIALALQAAHDRCLAHGHVRPACVFAGPLVPMSRPRADGTPRMRPSSVATVKLFELGLTPYRPPLSTWLDASQPLDPIDGFEYLPPERLETTELTPASDAYGLGATLFFLLTGRAPIQAATGAELLNKLRDEPPTPLELLRPDAPPALVVLVNGLLARDPAARTSIAAAIELLSGVSNPVLPAAESAPITLPPVDMQSEPPIDDIPDAMPVDSDVLPQHPAGELGHLPTLSAEDLGSLPTPGESAPQPYVPPGTWQPVQYTPVHPPGYVPQPSYVPQPNYVPQPGGYYPAPTGYPPQQPYAPQYQPAPVPQYQPAPTPSYAPEGVYGQTPDHPEDLTADASSEPLRPRHGDHGSKRWIIWLILGIILQVTAVLGWIYLFTGGAQPESEPTRPAPVKPKPKVKYIKKPAAKDLDE